jgi:hypothetical protein
MAFATLASVMLSLGTEGCREENKDSPGSGGQKNPTAPMPPRILSATINAVDGHFRTHTVCANCHSNASDATAMRNAAGREIGPVNLWRASMMANSFRDPYFRAVLAAEMEHHPALASVVQDTCLTCHAPQAAYEAHLAGGVQTLAEIYAGNTARAQIGLDGVTCTLCHQIEPTNLGTPASFSAKFSINPTKSAYGPHTSPFANPMINNTGYTPTYGAHINESKMCGSCHTLHTAVLDLNSNPTGAVFPEQVPYFEWRNSAFSTESASPGPKAASCQDCHMPKQDQDGHTISTRIARQPGGGDFPPVSARQPYGRHSMVGGNTLMLSILRDRASDLRPSASNADFNHLIDRTRHNLQTNTASVQINGLAFNAGTLQFEVAVTNRTGHKLPTSYPSRRAWLQVIVKNAQGAVVWRSGDFDSGGRLVDGSGAVLASEAASGPIQPHRDSITSQDQVQIYEAVHANVAGNPTFSLLFANSYWKDNRLLPEGWSNTHPNIADMAPIGVSADADFAGGSDTVSYQIAALASGTYTVEVSLLFQTISAREADELFLHDHLPEVNIFKQYYEASTRTPETLASASQTTP